MKSPSYPCSAKYLSTLVNVPLSSLSGSYAICMFGSSGIGMSGTVTAVLPWGRLGADTTGGVVFGVVSPAPKRIWLFGQSRGQLRQALRFITSSSSAPIGRRR